MDVSRARAVLLVFVGGALGTGAREALALAFPAAPGGFPTTILVVNVVGALLLGMLLEVLALRGPDQGRSRGLRLLLGTGVLGGFTTYSAFAADTAALLSGSPLEALLYVAATLALGLAASIAGIAAGGALAGRRAARGAS